MKHWVFVALLCFCFPLHAHEGHDHSMDGGNPYKQFGVPIEQKQAVDFSKRVINKLVEKRKLPMPWRDATFVEASQKVFKSDPEWVIAFKNESETNKTRSILYIFLSQYGDFLGANFTGK